MAGIVRRWKHPAALTAAEQAELLAKSVEQRARLQFGMFTVVPLFVSGVTIALIICTLTMDRRREIATLKPIAARTRPSLP